MRFILAFVVVACLSATASTAGAQAGIPTRELPGITSTLAGTVVSSTTTELIVDDNRGVRRHFMVDGSSGLPAGLVPGMRISVTFEVLEGGRAHLVGVGTSDTMDSDRPDDPPVSSDGALGGASASPVAGVPAVQATIGGEPAVRADPMPARREERHEGVSLFPPILVTAAVAVGVAVALRRRRTI